MTQEEKELLLKDLCARLPYGVNILADIDKTFDGGCIGILSKIEPYVGDKFPELKGQYLLYEKGCLTPLVVDEVRPYLRPMSSMTEEEKEEIEGISKRWIECTGIFIWPNEGDAVLPWSTIQVVLDFLNKHHFDYRGLIPMGLALIAPKGMYSHS